MTKTLDVMGRILALTVLPKESDLVLWKVIQGLKKKLSLSEEEIKEVNLNVTPDMTTWDRAKEQPKEIEFTDFECKMITDGLELLNKNKKITEQYLPLCIAFGLYEPE